MPIIRTEDKLIMYCHIPKCGGTTVTNFILSSKHNIGFVNRGYKSVKHKWSRTSPQHIEMHSMEVLNLIDIIDESFAVVRHPLERFVSAFHYNKKNGKIPFWMTLNQFLYRLRSANTKWHYAYDNHFRPMHEFVSESTHIVKLEDGESVIIGLLNKLIGKNAQTHTKEKKLNHANQKQEISYKWLISRSYIRHRTSIRSRGQLSSGQIRNILEYYALDFERFGYEMNSI